MRMRKYAKTSMDEVKLLDLKELSKEENSPLDNTESVASLYDI